VIVLDGAGWHGSAALVIPDNLSLLTLPPYNPELNPVENVWQYLRANRIAISVFVTHESGESPLGDRLAETGFSPVPAVTARRWFLARSGRPLPAPKAPMTAGETLRPAPAGSFLRAD
jgi:hypothetical protein